MNKTPLEARKGPKLMLSDPAGQDRYVNMLDVEIDQAAVDAKKMYGHGRLPDTMLAIYGRRPKKGNIVAVLVKEPRKFIRVMRYEDVGPVGRTREIAGVVTEVGWDLK